jgi:hypothetical protein
MWNKLTARNKIVVCLITYLVIGKLLTVGGTTGNSYFSKVIVPLGNTITKLSHEIFVDEPMEGLIAECKLQDKTVEQRVAVALCWGIILAGYLMIIIFFGLAVLIKYLVLYLWLFLLKPALSVIWQVLCFLFR